MEKERLVAASLELGAGVSAISARQGSIRASYLGAYTVLVNDSGVHLLALARLPVG